MGSGAISHHLSRVMNEYHHIKSGVDVSTQCAHLRHHACIKNDVDVSTAHTCDTMLEMEATIRPGLDCNTMSCAVTVICRDDMWCAERCAHPDDKL